MHGKVINLPKIMVGKPEGKRALERQFRWEDNIKVVVGDIGLRC
jgi:hypothetical protein